MTEEPPFELTTIHAILTEAFNEALRIRGRADNTSVDTAFAIGEALCALSKAKALVGRDIDQAAKAVKPDIS